MAAIDLQQWGGLRVVQSERRVLLIEDVPSEAELTMRELRKAGMDFLWRRVQTEAGLRRAVREFSPSLILSDFTLPQFDGMKALEISQEVAPQTPFIFVSGSIGEERAIDALRKGAADYVLKTNLSRLVPVVIRVLATENALPAPVTSLPPSALEGKMRKALALRQFELHYQPKVCVRTRRIEGVEALLRWRDPETGLAVAPAHFLPLLESSGMIVEVGEWILERAARDCRHWRRLGLPPIRTAVNISTAQLNRADFAHRFLQLTRPWASGVFSLDVEITEGALLGDSAPDIKKLQLLRSAGIRIALDDFGSGLSSLGKLSGLPIDSLKIDKIFVDDLLHDGPGKAMVATIIALARGLRMTVVAEGVETREQLEMLRQMGCDQSQGYLHSRAVTSDEFAELLEHGKGWLMLPAELPITGTEWERGSSLRVNAI